MDSIDIKLGSLKTKGDDIIVYFKDDKGRNGIEIKCKKALKLDTNMSSYKIFDSTFFNSYQNILYSTINYLELESTHIFGESITKNKILYMFKNNFMLPFKYNEKLTFNVYNDNTIIKSIDQKNIRLIIILKGLIFKKVGIEFNIELYEEYYSENENEKYSIDSDFRSDHVIDSDYNE